MSKSVTWGGVVVHYRENNSSCVLESKRRLLTERESIECSEMNTRDRNIKDTERLISFFADNTPVSGTWR